MYDEKRQKVELGDTIEFTNTENTDEKLRVQVTDIHVFDDFSALYRTLRDALPAHDETSFVASMHEIYAPEKVQRYKVAAFGVEVKTNET